MRSLISFAFSLEAILLTETTGRSEVVRCEVDRSEMVCFETVHFEVIHLRHSLQSEERWTTRPVLSAAKVHPYTRQFNFRQPEFQTHQLL